MQTILKLITAVALALVGTVVSLATLTHAAGPGDLDPTFGVGGVVTNTIGFSSEVYALTVQPDDKIIAAGITYPELDATAEMFIVRYNSNGSLDTTFNSTDIFTTNIHFEPYHLALQADGKILIAGTMVVDSPGNLEGCCIFAVLRLTANGMLDTTFNGTGIVTVNLRNSLSLFITAQPNGKIVAVGSRETPPFAQPDIYEAVVMRLHPDGSPDTTLNGTGVVTTFIDEQGDISGLGAVHPDGKIVVAITKRYLNPVSENSSNFATLRYNVDGSLDTTFGGTGIVTTDFDGNIGYDQPFSGVSVLPDGRIVVAGNNTIVSGNGSIAVVRYLPDGSLDTTLNGSGTITHLVTLGMNTGYYSPGQMVVQPNSKMVIVGSQLTSIAQTPPYQDLYQSGVFRLNEDGSLDASFGSSGVKQLDELAGSTYPVALQTDGKILVGSWPNGENQYFMIHRLLGDVAPPAFPAAPLLDPPDQAQLTNAQPHFDWLDADDDFGVISYTLTLTRADAPLTTQATTVFTSPISEYQLTSPLPNGSYQWSVQAFDYTGSTSQSVAPQVFTLQASDDRTIYLPVVIKGVE